jgi:hypothetical protein
MNATSLTADQIASVKTAALLAANYDLAERCRIAADDSQPVGLRVSARNDVAAALNRMAQAVR